MALGTTNISTGLVAQTIQENSSDVGTLCKSTKVNKWSKWKPVRIPKTGGITDADIESVCCGIYRVAYNTTPWDFGYNKPRGGVNEPFRLGDFRNYNHNAGSPVQIEIISVANTAFTTQTTPPFVLINGLTHTITFKLPLAGEIDPVTINTQTSRTKNTDADGGYGGLTWVCGSIDGSVIRSGSDVFTCPSGPLTTLTQQFIAQSGYMRMQYCKYNGSVAGTYETLPYLWAETDVMHDKFIIRNLNTDLNFVANTNFNIHYLNGYVYTNIVATNSESFNISQTRVRCVYNVNGGSNQTITTSNATLSTGNTSLQLTLSGWIDGQDNTFIVTPYLEMLNQDTGTWVIIGSDNPLQKVINIPIQQ